MCQMQKMRGPRQKAQKKRGQTGYSGKKWENGAHFPTILLHHKRAKHQPEAPLSLLKLVQLLIEGGYIVDARTAFIENFM